MLLTLAILDQLSYGSYRPAAAKFEEISGLTPKSHVYLDLLRHSDMGMDRNRIPVA
jgi:hypothetical protein